MVYKALAPFSLDIVHALTEHKATGCKALTTLVWLILTRGKASLVATTMDYYYHHSGGKGIDQQATAFDRKIAKLDNFSEVWLLAIAGATFDYAFNMNHTMIIIPCLRRQK